MTASVGPDYSWLPDHQLHVVATLAHADELVSRMGAVLYEYVAPPGPLALDTVATGDLARVIVTAVAPLPAAISRYAAAALTQLRGALEHVLYAEVEKELGRELSDAEGRQLEIPAAATVNKFDEWLSNKRRQQIKPLRRDAPLVARIRDLQPFQWEEADNHPLRVLAEYTNHAKHRAPAVAATRLGAVIPDFAAPGLGVAAWGAFRPIEAGDVIASSPKGTVVPLSIWPEISLQRPHTGNWHVLIKELEDLAEWVRTVAIPHLIVGTHEVDPLPPQLDTSVGHQDLRQAMLEASTVTATQRFRRRLNVGMARESLVEILALHPDRPSTAVLLQWVQALDDDQVLEKLGALGALPVTTGPQDLPAVAAATGQLLAEAQRHSDSDPVT